MVNALNNWQPFDKSKGGQFARGYRNEITGQEISRRAYLDIQARGEGFTSFDDYRRTTADSLTAQARALGFRDMGEVRRLRRNEMYEVFERIRMVRRGGVPIETLQDLTSPEGAEFNAAIAAAIRAGEWSPGRGEAHRGPELDHLFDLLEIEEYDRDDWIHDLEISG